MVASESFGSPESYHSGDRTARNRAGGRNGDSRGACSVNQPASDPVSGRPGDQLLVTARRGAEPKVKEEVFNKLVILKCNIETSGIMCAFRVPLLLLSRDSSRLWEFLLHFSQHVEQHALLDYHGLIGGGYMTERGRVHVQSIITGDQGRARFLVDTLNHGALPIIGWERNRFLISHTLAVLLAGAGARGPTSILSLVQVV
ncbi:hypothetical protein F4776DRAFT_665147 [Hypoxylon sp. NC0597]|nr:hypothetical protein F4776DRAFT_665147 [Hypoxylon sp. NC0597]